MRPATRPWSAHPQIPPGRSAGRRFAENIQRETARIVPAKRTAALETDRPGSTRIVLSCCIRQSANVTLVARDYIWKRTQAMNCPLLQIIIGAFRRYESKVGLVAQP